MAKPLAIYMARYAGRIYSSKEGRETLLKTIAELTEKATK